MTTNTFKFTELSTTSKEAAAKNVNQYLFLEHEGNRFHLMSLDLFADFKEQLSNSGFQYKQLSLCSTDFYGLHFSEVKKDNYLLETIIKDNTSTDIYKKYEKTKEVVKLLNRNEEFSFNMDDFWGDSPFQLLSPSVYIPFIEVDSKFLSILKYIVEVNSDDEIVSEHKFPALLESPVDRSSTQVLSENVGKINNDLLNTIKQVEEEINTEINMKLAVVKNKYLTDYANSLREDVQYIHCENLLSDENSEQHQKYTFSQDGSVVF